MLYPCQAPPTGNKAIDNTTEGSIHELLAFESQDSDDNVDTFWTDLLRSFMSDSLRLQFRDHPNRGASFSFLPSMIPQLCDICWNGTERNQAHQPVGKGQLEGWNLRSVELSHPASAINTLVQQDWFAENLGTEGESLLLSMTLVSRMTKGFFQFHIDNGTYELQRKRVSLLGSYLRH
ncbi:hypothetical protein ACJZ2D_011219 [Fusarium nematophilum]